MAQFGKADIGLIKATAGAEASKFMDDSALAIGSTIGQVMEQQAEKMATAFQTQQKEAKKAAEKFEKDFNDAYKMPEGGVPPKMMKILNEELMRHKSIYASAYGNSTESKVTRAKSLSDWGAFVEKFDNMIGGIQSSQTSKVRPKGQDNISHMSAAAIRNMDNRVEFGVKIEKDGSASPVVAVDKLGEHPGEFGDKRNNRIKELQALPQVGINPALKVELENLLVQKKEHEEKVVNWGNLNKEKPTVIDQISGLEVFNEDRYLVYGSDFPTFGNVDKVDGKAIELYSKNIIGGGGSNAASDNFHNKPLSLQQEKQDFSDGLKGEVDTYDEMMHMLYSDFSEDFGDINIGTKERPEIVGNSFANLFINEMAKTTDGEILNSTSDSSATNMNDMYTDTDGNPLQILTEGEGTVEYGSQDWLALSKGERKEYLEKHLRGYDASNNHDWQSNTEWSIDKFSNFMAKVKIEHKENLKREHFEKSNRYFNSGAGETSYSTEQEAMKQKRKSYNKVAFEVAFPESMLNSDNLAENLQKGGSIAEALKTEFKMHKKTTEEDNRVFDWDFKNDSELELKLQLQDEDEATKYKFDFSSENSREEYLRLKELLEEVGVEGEYLMEIPNDVNEWDVIRSKVNVYHPQGPNIFDPAANLPIDSEGNIITQ